MYRIFLITGATELVDNFKRALDTTATIMSADPIEANVVEAAKQFKPDLVVVDSDVHTGPQTTFERLSLIRTWFADLPVIVVGNEMGAQLILTSMRAGAQDFVDRDASDRELRAVVTRHLASTPVASAQEKGKLVCVLSPTPGDEGRDLPVNIATILASRRKDSVILVDLSLPASEAGIALNLDLSFRLGEAVKDIARLDRALLDGALAQCPHTGLYVLPLSRYGDADGWAVDMQDLRALLQILQSLYEVVVIDYGPFSRHEELITLPGTNASFFLTCNQRFTSIKAAGELMRIVKGLRPKGRAPVLAVHEFAPKNTPLFEDIVSALTPEKAIRLSVRWGQLAESVNRGVPLSLAGPSPYVDELVKSLASEELLPESDNPAQEEVPIRHFIRRVMSVVL